MELIAVIAASTTSNRTPGYRWRSIASNMRPRKGRLRCSHGRRFAEDEDPASTLGLHGWKLANRGFAGNRGGKNCQPKRWFRVNASRPFDFDEKAGGITISKKARGHTSSKHKNAAGTSVAAKRRNSQTRRRLMGRARRARRRRAVSACTGRGRGWLGLFGFAACVAWMTYRHPHQLAELAASALRPIAVAGRANRFQECLLVDEHGGPDQFRGVEVLQKALVKGRVLLRQQERLRASPLASM